MTYCDAELPSLILVGGIDFEGNVLRDVWRSEDDGETWTEVLGNGHTQWANYDMSGGIRDHAMVTLGKTVFIIGGRSTAPGNRNGDVYYSNDRGETWNVITTGVPVALKVYAPAVAGYGNKLYVFGGGNAPPTTAVTTGTWDSVSETFSWSASSPLPIALREACACIVPPVAPEMNPTMVVLFGETSTSGVFSNLALVAVDSGPIVTWNSHVIGTARPRAAAQCVYDASSNCVVVMGGGEPNAAFQRQHNDIWVAHESDLTAWYPLSFDATFSPRSRFGLAITSNHRIVIAGGNEGTVASASAGERTNDVWRSFPTAELYTSVVARPIENSLTTRLLRHQLTATPDSWYRFGVTSSKFAPTESTNSTVIINVEGYERAATVPSDMSGYFDLAVPDENTTRSTTLTAWGTFDAGTFTSGIADLAYNESDDSVYAAGGNVIARGIFDGDSFFNWTTTHTLNPDLTILGVAPTTGHQSYSCAALVMNSNPMAQFEHNILLFSSQIETGPVTTIVDLGFANNPMTHLSIGLTTISMYILVLTDVNELVTPSNTILISQPQPLNDVAATIGLFTSIPSHASTSHQWSRSVFIEPSWALCGTLSTNVLHGCILKLTNFLDEPNIQYVFRDTLVDNITTLPPLVDIAYAKPEDVGGQGRIVAVSNDASGSIIYSNDLGDTWHAGPPIELSQWRPHARVTWSSRFRAFLMTSDSTTEGQAYGQNSLVAWFFDSTTSTWDSVLRRLRARAGTWGPVVWSETYARFLVANTANDSINISVPPSGTSDVLIRKDTPPGFYQVHMQVTKPFPEFPSESQVLEPLHIHVLDVAVGSRTAGRTVPPMRSVHGGFGETGALFNIRSGERAPPRLGDYNTWNGFVDHGESVDNPEEYVEYTLQGYGDNLNALPEELRITRMPDARSARRFTYVVVDKNTIRLRFYDPALTTRRTVKLSYGEHIEREVVL